MLVSFSVANFRSFHEEQTFNLIASNRLGRSHEGHAAPVPDSDARVLRMAVVYGANGAGKSNLFKALAYVKSIGLWTRSRNAGTNREAFRFGGESQALSSFDIQFVTDGRLYRFGFDVDDQRIHQEWLVHVVGGREKVIYERATDSEGKVTIEAPGLDSPSKKLQALTTVGGPQNQSFLATAYSTLDDSELDSNLKRAIDWLDHGLILIAPGESSQPIGSLLVLGPDVLTFAGEFLRSSSTGVDHLRIGQRELSESDLKKWPDELVTQLRSMAATRATVLRLPDGGELMCDPSGRICEITIEAAHKNATDQIVPLKFAEESDGTRRLLELIPALRPQGSREEVYFVDEIDRSMHPNLVWKFLDFFIRSNGGAQRQIIVTTHESNLLDLDLVRRDEIWFAEKDGQQATHLYSLADFKVRNDLEIRKHYIQGRFGAIPFLGNLDRLLEPAETT